MAILDSVKAWLLGVALGKGIKSLAKLIVSYCLAKGVSFIGVIGGINIDTNSELAITAAINSALKSLFVFIKTKFPGKFEYLP